MEAHSDSITKGGRASASTGESGADLVVVSAFGRGNWLATELASRGWNITLVDITESLGSWDPEDAEGPFGLLEPTDLLTSQIQRVIDEGELANVPSGLTVWLKTGPVELQGPLASFQFESQRLGSAVASYLKQASTPSKEINRELKRLAKFPFRDVWFAAFLHQLASPVMKENHRALESGDVVPAFTRFSIRRTTHAGLKKGLELCRKAGVTVRERSRVIDVRLNERLVDAIEVRDERAGIERGRAFVWTLSSAETAIAARDVFESLYPRGQVRPDWSWLRYRFDFKSAAQDDQIPPHVVIVEDPYLPWTGTNVLVLRKRPKAREYDVWLRLPSRARTDKTYIEAVGKDAQAVLARRLPQLAPELVELPREARVATEIPALQPVFTSEALSSLQTLKANNLFFCGPEQNPFLDWVGWFRRQNEIVVKLEKLRAQWLAAERKRLASQGVSPNDSNTRSPSP